MELLTTRKFNGVALDCYKAENQDDGFWATREQIGQLLGYKNPRIAISIIHKRHKENLDRYSSVIILNTEAGERETVIYNFKGFLEICRYSKQPKAEAVIKFCWEVMDEIRRTGSYGKEEFVPIVAKGVVGPQSVLDFTGCFVGMNVRYVSLNNKKI